MNEYEIFNTLIRQALANVPEQYLQTSYDLGYFNTIPNGRTHLINGDEVLRFGERVFCYEFYYQLRKVIEEHREIEPGFFEHYFLQGEVKKLQVMDLLDNLNLHFLDGNYSPDLLFHQPGNANNAFVIEIKVTPDLNQNEIRHDIDKLIQFVDRYKYQRGLFICHNNDPDGIIQSIRNSDAFFLPINRQRVEDVTDNITLMIRPLFENHYQEYVLTEILD